RSGPHDARGGRGGPGRDAPGGGASHAAGRRAAWGVPALDGEPMREWRIAVALAVSPVVTGSGLAQGSLTEAAERVRQAWLAHNVQAGVGQSASVVLQIPGADPSAPVDRAQAIELLPRHLRAGAEPRLRG